MSSSRQGAYRRTALALLAALALLIVSTAAIIPSHWHSGQQDRTCDICRSGHLPSLAPLVRIEIQSSAPVEWHWPGAESEPAAEPVSSPSSPRAPPA